MSKQVPGPTALSKVGVERHPTQHWAKAVAEEETVYLLHSRECLLEYEDLTECPFSIAMDSGIEPAEWPQDEPTQVEIFPSAVRPRLRPAGGGLR